MGTNAIRIRQNRAVPQPGGRPSRLPPADWIRLTCCMSPTSAWPQRVRQIDPCGRALRHAEPCCDGAADAARAEPAVARLRPGVVARRDRDDARPQDREHQVVAVSSQTPARVAARRGRAEAGGRTEVLRYECKRVQIQVSTESARQEKSVNITECDREPDVLEAVMSGCLAPWKHCRHRRPCDPGDPGDDDLRSHASRCPVCADLAAVAVVLRAERDDAWREARVPTSGQVWWRATMRRRAEATAAAARPITMLQGLAGACAAGVCAAVIALAWPSTGQPLPGSPRRCPRRGNGLARRRCRRW